MTKKTFANTTNGSKEEQSLENYKSHLIPMDKNGSLKIRLISIRLSFFLASSSRD